LPPVAVLDASAVVAFLMRERGHEAVRRVITGGTGTVVASTNMVEALDVARRKGHAQSSDDLLADLSQLSVHVEPVTEADVLEAVYVLRRAEEEKRLHPEVGGISLGDATCLAVAKRLGLRVVASDSAWNVLGTGVEVLAFR
jgi:ribonuclease VapC